jgi:alpha-mannosidase
MDSLHTQELWAGGQNGFRGYILESGSPVLKIKMQLKGDERHVLQKATFPLNLETDRATYDTAAGAIDRPTRPQTAAEKAQWEVPGLRWADMSTADYGVSILSDRKHGYDHKPNEIRLTLLRSPEWPDPETDKGIHRFSFAIYPHAGTWQTAQTVQKSREFSQPLQAIVLTNPQTAGTLPTEASLLSLGAENLVLTALKRSQTHPNTFILRCYEAHGQSTQLNFSNAFGGKLGDRLDLLERPIADQSTTIHPWQIATITIDPPNKQ